VYKVDPRLCVLARNLLSNDDWRAADAYEVEEVRPKMPLVSKPASLACRAERLARARACPALSAVVPSGHSKGSGPDPDTGEEVTLGVLLEFIGVQV
jgi:hypothetical protein